MGGPSNILSLSWVELSLPVVVLMHFFVYVVVCLSPPGVCLAEAGHSLSAVPSPVPSYNVASSSLSLIEMPHPIL